MTLSELRRVALFGHSIDAEVTFNTETLVALIDVAEAAQDVGTGCQLSMLGPEATRDWCVTHQEWSYRAGPRCPNEVLAQALDRLNDLLPQEYPGA